MQKELSVFAGEDDMQRLRAAADFLRENPVTTLTIPPGIYELTTPLARETRQKVMDGSFGDNPERIMFSPEFSYSVGVDFSDTADCTVEAYGVTLLVDGFMEPVSVRGSRNLTIRGLTVDHKRKPFSMGIVRAVGEDYMDVLFGAEYPLTAGTPMPRACLYDPYAAHFVDYNDFRIERVEMLAAQLFRFHAKNLQRRYVGMELYVWHTFHSRPAIFLFNSSNITLRDVTIHSQPGMGVVAHRCENLHFDGLRVVPSVGVHVSTNTDATHIVSCKGSLLYENCLFEGQGDDALNVHTYYHSIMSADGCRASLYMEAPTGTHSQKQDLPDPGDALELTVRGTLQKKDVFRVLAVESTGANRCLVTLDHPLPAGSENALLVNATQQPVLTYCHNYSHSHFARGVLIKTKRAYIEDNTFFDIIGTAINVAAEEWWYEACCTTEEIVIRRNRILFCGRNDDIRQQDAGGICVTVCASNPVEATHDNIVITDNEIECPDAPRAIYVSNAKQLVLARNRTLCLSGEGIIVEKTAPPGD